VPHAQQTAITAAAAATASDPAKAERIAAALEKMREAARRKLHVKVFCADGSTVPVVVDEALSAADLLDVMVERNHVQLQPTWALVEHLPELYMERYV